MEHRQPGRSGLKALVLSFGSGTFDGVGDFLEERGTTDVQEAAQW